jgi:hypothetical protein
MSGKDASVLSRVLQHTVDHNRILLAQKGRPTRSFTFSCWSFILLVRPTDLSEEPEFNYEALGMRKPSAKSSNEPAPKVA